ncbi:hypothetical protein [Methylorubrum sp. SB2]|uniref:hypothetical protein n=1 Tax=Methylorubrum subtropicum TaxID=3138812 RepID=UPI00313C282B
MRLDALEVIRTLTHDIAAHEALADKLDQLATEAHDEGAFAKADVFRLVVREYRFRAMKSRGSLEFISDRYHLKYKSKF